MSRPIMVLLAILAFSSFSFSADVNQSGVCYSQCAVYDLVWQDDYCWATFQHFCTMDKTDVALEMVGAWVSYVERGPDFNFLATTYMCVELVDECIGPILDNCRASCAYDNLAYAPNLYVHSAYYDEDDGYLHVTVRNNGLAYMPAASIAAYGAHSDAYGVNDSDFSLILNTSIPALRPHDVHYSPTSYIDEQKFIFDWQPEDGEYNVARMVITADPDYAERSSRDNTFDLVINDLPSPADVRLGALSAERQAPQTDSFIITAPLENLGEQSADVTVEFYVGKPIPANLVASEGATLSGGESEDVLALVVFPSPSSIYSTVRVVSGGKVVAESRIYPGPQFLKISGIVVDEEGNPVSGASIGDSKGSGFPLVSGTARYTTSDSRGKFEFPLYSREGTINLYASANGYFSNQTSVRFVYDAGDDFIVDELQSVYVTIVLTQHPLEIVVDYPERGRFIIETDKGRYTGEYIPTVGIPVRGNNGTLAVFSSLCSPFITEFNTSFQGTSVQAPGIYCLDPDEDDDYQPTDSKSLVFEKEYPSEIAEMGFFDKRGDHAYVVTINKDDSLCNLYSYSLPGGEQLYRKALNTHCLQSSAFIPSYDGSMLYVGLGVAKTVKTGLNHSVGYILDEQGNALSSWDYPDMTYNLEHSSATEFLDILEFMPGSVYREAPVEECMLIEALLCNASPTRYSIDDFGISKNRALGTCNSSSCVFTLGDTDYVQIPKVPAGGMVVGNYVNDDLFSASSKGGSYLQGGTALWSVTDRISDISMSPGGGYVLVSTEPYGMKLFQSDGTDVTPSDVAKDSARGFGATERGIFYFSTKNSKGTVYRMTTMAEPESGTSSSDSGGFFNFIGLLFQYLLDMFNAMIDYFASFL
jgi:hypothetical protein